jgi:glycosyltransferase involved in cell wall biosynthesis
VIYCGVSDVFRPVNDTRLIDNILQKYKISSPFILHVGGLQKSKNIGRLLSAFRVLLSEYKEDIALVMVGVEPMFFRREYKCLINNIRKLDLDSKVTILGYLPDSELIALYNRAVVLVHPSLCEGFGLTPLEAMACGTPVVVSNKSSIPEVVGDAGIYIDPHQPGDIARGMHQIIENEQLRNQLREKGLRRARLFSWKYAAEKTLGVYSQAFKGSVLK